MLPIYALAVSAFIFNTSEFIPVALLSDIGKSFAMTSDEVGLMMTVYAWLVACLSLPLMLATAKLERKKLLIGLFLLFALAHGVSFMANSFAVLLVSRAMVAVCHAVFWSITASLVVRLAPDGKGSQALGLLATGGAVAMILGLPLGRIVGQLSDWRVAFLGIGLIGLGVALLLIKTLPSLPAKSTGNLASLPKLAKNHSVTVRYALILLVVAAHFTAYSYIEPFVLMAGFSGAVATGVLLLFGVAGIVSSWVFGRFYDRLEYRLMWGAFFVMLVCLTLLWAVSSHQMAWLLVAMFWGACANLLGLSLQMQVLHGAGDDKDVAMSIFSAIFNVGIGGGALIGGLVLAKFGLSAIGMAGAMILVVAMVVFGGMRGVEGRKLAPDK